MSKTCILEKKMHRSLRLFGTLALGLFGAAACSDSSGTGDYDGFRLVIDPTKSSITLNDGSTPQVMFPSAGQSGIKINLDRPIALTENGSVMTLDFDVGRSFVMRGNNARNGFIFKPVINAVARDITGSVTGSVRANSATGAAVPGATVEVLTAGSLLTDTDPTHLVRSTSTDANGDYRIAFLLPGPYVVRATPPTASGFKPALLPAGLTITTGTETQNQIIVVAP
ncbi:MAG: carboxypeptidase regulatory-like domain-containing protein [Gemmatimonadaceae bacterium]